MRNTRKYGLFERQNGRWVQLYPSLVGSLNWARRVFQDALLVHVYGFAENERRLRPVEVRYET